MLLCLFKVREIFRPFTLLLFTLTTSFHSNTLLGSLTTTFRFDTPTSPFTLCGQPYKTLLEHTSSLLPSLNTLPHHIHNNTHQHALCPPPSSLFLSSPSHTRQRLCLTNIVFGRRSYLHTLLPNH